MARSKTETEEVETDDLDSTEEIQDELDGDIEKSDDAVEADVADDDDWTEDSDDDSEDDSDDEEATEDLDELESEELEMLTEDELSETLVVDEAAELRAIRRAELAMSGETGTERGDDEFLCQGCFLVLNSSQLSDKRRKLCVDCAG